jgi:hypothetical protein
MLLWFDLETIRLRQQETKSDTVQEVQYSPVRVFNAVRPLQKQWKVEGNVQ